MGEEMLLGGQKVIPKRLIREGYSYFVNNSISAVLLYNNNYYNYNKGFVFEDDNIINAIKSALKN